jgi:ferrous iron transport protein B
VNGGCAGCPAKAAGCGSKLDLVALLGNPNSGKTTIFNALTGLHQKVGNYPGVTVDRRTGRAELGGRSVEVLDLPGTYSLVATSPDEQVVSDVLRGARGGLRSPDVLVAVVDASNLARNLYLVSQLLDLGQPLVVALNMTDVAARRQQPVDARRLSRALGCSVVPVVGHRRAGIEDLRLAIEAAGPCPSPSYPIPLPMLERERRLAGPLANRCRCDQRTAERLARRLLIGDPSTDLAPLRAQPALAAELQHALAELRTLGLDPMQADIEARYRWIDEIVASAVAHRTGAPRDRSDAIDAVLVHKVWGLFIFAAVMGVLFMGVFWAAKPVMNGVQSGLAFFAEAVTTRLPAGALADLVRNGIFGGVGAVMVFVPQVAVLFLLLAILEDSGYLARAAFLMDRVLGRVGLHGKSFVPLLSCFACAIPGILSARTIENRRERLTTIFVAPFMSCSARLPVYTLLIAVCFAGRGAVTQGFVLLALYLLGIVAAALTALVIRRRLDSRRSSPFILEMPAYKVPQPSQVAWQAWTHTRSFVTRAGTTIFALSVLLWALFYYPRLPAAEAAAHPSQAERAAAQVEHSVAGRFGHAIEPAVRPLGYDWRIAVGLVAAFAAREVFVSTLGITYSVADAGKHAETLSSAMQAETRPDGRPVWTVATALSLMVWFVLAMQCLSTLAVVRRETGGWRWPLAQVLFMNSLAYSLALVCHRTAVVFWGG